MNHAHQKREEIAKNILSIYSNKEQLTTKEMSVEEFEKSFPVEQFTVVTDKIMKSYVTETVEKVKAITEKQEKDDFIKKSADEINSFERIIVSASNAVKKHFYVKKKEQASD